MTDSNLTVNCAYIFYTDALSNQVPTPLITDTPVDIFGHLTDKYKGIGRLKDIRQCSVNSDGGISITVASTNGEFYGIPFSDGVTIYAAALCVAGNTKENDTLITYETLEKPDETFSVKPAASDIMLSIELNWEVL